MRLTLLEAATETGIDDVTMVKLLDGRCFIEDMLIVDVALAARLAAAAVIVDAAPPEFTVEFLTKIDDRTI